MATQRAVTSQRVVNVGTVADMRSSSVSGGPGCGRGLVAHRAVDLATGRGWKLELPMWSNVEASFHRVPYVRHGGVGDSRVSAWNWH